jgi:hypothetical protein
MRPYSRAGPLYLCRSGRTVEALTVSVGKRSGTVARTAPVAPVKSGLYRMAAGDRRWELVTRGLPEAPTIRAIATHPEHAETVFVGTQHGPYRSTDHARPM